MLQKSTQFVVDDNTQLNLDIQSGVFKPTATTTFLIDSVSDYATQPGKLLDLGSGSGVVGIALFLKNLASSPLYASDFSKPAIGSIEKNCHDHNVPIEVRHGSLFEPWAEEKFDYIVDDISGVAEEAAKLSPWFDDIPCNSGPDGCDLTMEVLNQASDFLNPNGRLFFPAISFSNTEKIIECARENFSHVELLRREEWPLPPEMAPHLSALKEIENKGHIQLKELFGMTICFTEIYVAFNSN